jgi:AcrR family transcriptional regulator
MIELAATVGADRMTARGLCEHAGASPRTFYLYYDDLPTAFGHACAELERDLRAAVRGAHAGSRGQSPRRRVGAVVRAALAYLADDPVRADCLVVQSACVGPAAHTARVATLAWFAALLDDAVADAPEPAIGRALATELAVGSLHARVYGAVVDGRVVELLGEAERLAELVLLPFVAVARPGVGGRRPRAARRTSDVPSGVLAGGSGPTSDDARGAAQPRAAASHRSVVSRAVASAASASATQVLSSGPPPRC